MPQPWVAPVPAEAAELDGVRVADVADGPTAAELFERFDLHVTTMGRTVHEDPLFFATCIAAGRLLAQHAGDPTGRTARTRPGPTTRRITAVAKLDRLLNLTAALLEARVPMTAEEIRTRVPGYAGTSDEAFHRSFERDKDDLRELGVPIETVQVGHHEQPTSAYTIERSRYELPDPGFELDELAAIQLAATAVQLEGLDPDDAEEGLRKLGGVVPTSGPDAPQGAAAGTPWERCRLPRRCSTCSSRYSSVARCTSATAARHAPSSPTGCSSSAAAGT